MTLREIVNNILLEEGGDSEISFSVWMKKIKDFLEKKYENYDVFFSLVSDEENFDGFKKTKKFKIKEDPDFDINSNIKEGTIKDKQILIRYKENKEKRKRNVKVYKIDNEESKPLLGSSSTLQVKAAYSQLLKLYDTEKENQDVEKYSKKRTIDDLANALNAENIKKIKEHIEPETKNNLYKPGEPYPLNIDGYSIIVAKSTKENNPNLFYYLNNNDNYYPLGILKSAISKAQRGDWTKNPYEQGMKTEKLSKEAGKRIAQENNKETKDDNINNYITDGKFDIEKLEKNTLYSFSYSVGATTKYNKNGDRTANSADINYTFNNKSIDIEVKRTFYETRSKKNPFMENGKIKQSLQGTLYPILRLLETTVNKYSVGIYVYGLNEAKKDEVVYVDNTNPNFTEVGLDNYLLDKLQKENSKMFTKNKVQIKSYDDLSSEKVKRISSLKEFENSFIIPNISKIEKVINVNGDIKRKNLSVVTEGIFDNVKKGVTAAKMALALGTSKLDPNYKSSQNYQQNTKIERQYNQNQEIFKAAKKSLDSIINFCKKYGLNNSLQEANRLLPLLNKKLIAASIETKYFNY